MLLTLVQARSVTKLCPTLCNPMDCSPPGFSVHGIFQARILEWVAISYSRRSSQPSDQTRISHVSCISSLYHSATCEAPADPRGMYRYIYEGMCTKAQRERQMEALKPTILPTLLSVSRGLCRLAPWLLWLLVFADMNLNSQNLSVIGFRILLLKVVGFNLLMTLRLWSSWGELTSQPCGGAPGAGPQALKRNFPQALAFRS